jgi:hypothetical protein
MNSKKINNLAADLEIIVAQADRTVNHGSLSRLQTQDNVSYSLNLESRLKYKEIIQEILKFDCFVEKFSSAYITRKIDKLISRKLREPTINLAQVLHETMVNLQLLSLNTVVYLPIDGMVCSQPIKIGNVTFQFCDEALLEKIIISTISSTDTTENGQDKLKRARQSLRESLSKELLSRCIGIYSAAAEMSRANECAILEVNFAIDVIKLTSKYCQPIEKDIRISIKGFRPRSQYGGLITSEEDYRVFSRPIGSLPPFDLEPAALAKMAELGLSDLLTRHKEEKLSDIDRLLKASLRWLSIALNQDEPQIAILALIISLEVLFKAPAGYSVEGTVAEATAFIIARTPDGRRRVVQTVQEFYGKRSGVTHGGAREEITAQDRHLLTYFVCSTISTILKNLNHLRSQKDLMDWIESIKYGDTQPVGI